MMKYKRLTISSKNIVQQFENIKPENRNGFSLKCFDRLAELEDKIEQGTLIEVIFKVGDTVYETDGVMIYEYKIDRLVFVDKMIIYDTPEIMFDERAVGYSIFPTREEAKKKLQEKRNENKSDL